MLHWGADWTSIWNTWNSNLKRKKCIFVEFLSNPLFVLFAHKITIQSQKLIFENTKVFVSMINTFTEFQNHSSITWFMSFSVKMFLSLFYMKNQIIPFPTYGIHIYFYFRTFFHSKSNFLYFIICCVIRDSEHIQRGQNFNKNH